MQKIKQLISVAISLSLLFLPLQAANIQVDTTTSTSLDSARNGVPIVNIANPNTRGLSHNKFSEYNVAKEGVILNNSLDTTVKTQLGGYIFGNKNLTTNAKVILNEVTSTSRTNLNGYTEVAGKHADLVIANPNGISVNGAGFINTSNVTLSTGKPTITNGVISSYNIVGGDISIEGKGLDATTTNTANLYTKALQLNAKIYANKLNVKLGSNTPNSSALLLDSSALGGMYANAITLVGTNKGVGVNLPPEVVASTGDIIITNDGMIKLQKVTAKKNINIDGKSANIEVADKLTSTNNINLVAKDITNNSLVNAGNDLTITAENLTNNKTLFSANDSYLYVNNTLLNNENSNIFVLNNLKMAADNTNAKTALIRNTSANIETLHGDINLYADVFENIVSNEPTTYEISRKTTQRWRQISGDWRTLETTTHIIEGINKDGYKVSSLRSGNNINLYTNVYNKYSTITATGDMLIDGSLNNIANVEAYDKTIVSGYVQHYEKKHKYSHHAWYYKYSTYNINTIKLDAANSLLQASKNINIIGNSLQNGNLNSNANIPSSTDIVNTPTQTAYIDKATNEPIITLPTDTASLFVKAQPQSNYLIETNPDFTIYDNFISSDYMMSHINYDAVATSKRLGDAMYENTLVRDSIFAQTGKRFLNKDIKNDNEQYKYLMDNAISASQDLELSPGISLTQAQINALKKDIVWMEEKVVDGQKVLVPVVYIANANSYRLQGAQIIANDDINLNSDTFTNTATLQAGNDVTINANKTITNTAGTLKAGNHLSLQAKNDIINTSGTIKAKNIDLTSTEGSITNKRYAKDVSYGIGSTVDNKTLIGNSANIQAKNTLNINAADDFVNAGSNLKAKDVNLNANNVAITTTVDKKDLFGGSSDAYIKEQSTTHLASNINADNININSTETTNIKGSNLKANNNINIKAKELNILAVNNSTYTERHSSSKGFLSSSSSTTKTANSKSQAANLNGANINLTSTKESIDIKGANLTAKEQLSLQSANNINVEAGYDGSMNESHTEKSGLFSGGNIYSKSEDLEGKLTKTATNAQLNASDIKLKANNSIAMTGVDIQATNNLDAASQNIALKNATNEEQTYSKHTKIAVGYGDIVKSITNPQDLVSYKDGKASMTLAKATYDKDTKTKNTTSVASSNIDAKNINFNASSEKKDNGNILIQASNLNAKEDVNLQASNDITIKEDKTKSTSNSKDIHGKAELKLNVKNEYVQIGYALKAVQDATKALKQTKTDYANYKKELSSQESKLQDLQTKYANHTGFIEHADVQEMQELVDDLKSDDAYYKTNIVLATTTLATKTTALLAQTAKAASSSGTYGFNAGLELDIDAIEKQLKEYNEKSVASNINAKNITLASGEKTNIQGSSLQANNNINIEAKETNIVASQDRNTNSSNKEHKNINVAYDVYGGLSASASADSANSNQEKLYNTNAKLQANNIVINTKEDTNIKGANLKADDTLNINTKNLTVASVQDRQKSRSHSKGISAGYSSGSLSSVGINQSSAHANSKQTIQTDILANRVNINTAKHTDIKGATIASVDKDGNDNHQLNLKTDTLTVSSLNNTNNSKSNAIGITVGGSVKNNTASNVSLNFANDKTNSKTKTLATLGKGNIQIADKEHSDTKMLNTDIVNNTVDIYNISSHKGLKGELDTKLLTKSGRKAIKKDAKEFGKNIQTVAKGLPEANNKNIIIATIGKGLNKLSSITGGIVPSNGENGGLVGNVPVMLGDKDINQKFLQVVTSDSKYAKQDRKNFRNIEESDYYKAADKKTQDSLKGRGLLVSIKPIKIDSKNATYQNFTNGMLNHEALAIKNAIDQTGSDIVTINYNPTHGLFGDALESGVDKFGLGTTGIAKQTGEFIYDVTASRAKEGSNFAAHSQGNLLTKSGIEYRKSHGGFKDRSYFIDATLPTIKQREQAVPTFAGYGSPVNTEDMKKVVTINKSGDKQFNFDGMYTKNNDFVGEFLGNNKGENMSNPNRDIVNTLVDGYKLFTDTSPHSTYDCQSNPNAHCGKRAW